MVADINGDEGPACFPVESNPGTDRDINVIFATLFTRGVNISWNKIYKPRLIRPFVPPSESLFLENPCERPFDYDAELEKPADISDSKSLEMLLSKLGDIPRKKIEEYLKTRGAFLASVIRADIDHPVPNNWHEIPKEKNSTQKIMVDKTNHETSDSDKSLELILFKTIESITGFSQDTLEPNMRLLDDLNMDSIKSGDLLTRVAKKTGITGEIVPMDFSKVTLQEIINNIKLAKANIPKSMKDRKPDILQTILDRTAELLSFRVKDINADMVLSSDLKVNKTQLKSLLPSLSSHIKVDIHVDLDPLLKRTLRQIASILERLYEQQKKPSQESTIETHRSPWTREFCVSMVHQPLSETITKNERRREDNWQHAHALIVADALENTLATTLSEKLLRMGAEVDIVTHTNALEQDLVYRSEYSHFFNILPVESVNTKSTFENVNLKDIITRLYSTTRIAPASSAPRRRNTLAYIQFGGGFFGNQSKQDYPNHYCATALAASMHQERPDLRVRVIDFSHRISVDKIADKTIAEIRTKGGFSAAGYDSNLVRRVRFQSLMEPETYKVYPFSWNKKDVILVTGGAKGITAQCALGVAKTCGAQMALVGSSPFPDLSLNHSDDNEILKLLNRYAEHNLIAKYFSCDIRNRKAVDKLIEQIRTEMGPITGVIHGAGLNKPKITSMVSIDDAIR